MQFPLKKKVLAEDETSDLAISFASILNEGDVVVLNGDLGAGKTFFIRSILRQYRYNDVNSPTFAIVNEYDTSKKIFHFDFYRIEEERELYDIGFDEYMNDAEAIKFIEWGNLFPQMIPQKRIEINILINEDSSRDITISKTYE